MKEEKSSVTNGQTIGDNAGPKLAYAAPELVEYGTVAKLTQGSGRSGSDGFRQRTSSCL